MSIAARNAMLAGGAGPTPGPRWLTFTSLSDYSHVGMYAVGTPPAISLEYSVDGVTWLPWINSEIDTNDYEMTEEGACLFIRAADGGNTRFASSEADFWEFYSWDGMMSVSGDITSLLDNSQQVMSLAGRDYCFCNLFNDIAYYFTDAKDLLLPSTTLAPYCYCGLLNSGDFPVAPELPAMTLAERCYKDMFRGNTGLTTVVLPATTLADYCYEQMFQGSWLATAPELPATNLAPGCYKQMFAWCHGLTSVVDLPATVLANVCYVNMFQNCSSISGVRVGFTSWTPTTACGSWFFSANSSGTFYCPTALGTDATITRGTSYCPTGWTVVNTDA